MYPFRAGSFAVKNAWYVAAFTHELGRELLSRTILNKPVVLYRKEDGTAVAVGGRCPHRHFPLGKSCLKGDAIQCGYHGIIFDSDGSCLKIPAQDAIPRAYRIPTYPLIEHGMWAWIWMGDPEKADRALLPDLSTIGYAQPGWITRPFYFHEVACRYQLLNDNLLDLSHIGYLHQNTIGTEDNASTPEERHRGERFLSTRRYLHKCPSPAFVKEIGEELPHHDRIVGMDSYLPGFHAGIGDHAYSDDHPEKAGQVFSANRVFHAITPSTHRSSYYFFGMSSTDSARMDIAHEFLKRVFEEDIFASVEIEKMLGTVGEAQKEILLRTDANAIEFRRMMQAMMDMEIQT